MENQMLSLYDYLGKAAGRDLGNQVYKAASAQKVKVTEKQVSNPAYSGKILMYPKSFLDSYFQVEQVDDLPF
jgi:hypothetical protein